MKPRNFPGRKALRRERAAARAEHRTQPAGAPEVRDINARIGRKNRHRDGTAL